MLNTLNCYSPGCGGENILREKKQKQNRGTIIYSSLFARNGSIARTATVKNNYEKRNEK